ncbi:unnamed protein product [Lathyrus sativus]|nr:unnamed protein product [Lathyrus sativus]
MQDKLVQHIENPKLINKVKDATDDVFTWNSIEDKKFKQRAKINWLGLGDGNNIYFHAQVKAKQSQNEMTAICKDDGTLLTNPTDIEAEVLHFYGNLMGRANDNQTGIDIVVMREGP